MEATLKEYTWAEPGRLSSALTDTRHVGPVHVSNITVLMKDGWFLSLVHFSQVLAVLLVTASVPGPVHVNYRHPHPSTTMSL